MKHIDSDYSDVLSIDEVLLFLQTFFQKKDEGNQEQVSSLELSERLKANHVKLIGILNSLTSHHKISMSQSKEIILWNLTKEGEIYATHGTPESQLIQILSTIDKHLTLKELNDLPGLSSDMISIGVKNAMKLKWLTINKASKCLEVSITDKSSIDQCQQYLKIIQDASDYHVPQHELIDKLIQYGCDLTDPQRVEKQLLQELKKRKLIEMRKIKFYMIFPDKELQSPLKYLATDLTQDMIIKDTWKDLDFKPYNFYSAGVKPQRGSIHPLMRVLKKFKKILLSMNFEEMPTKHWVESSFWNFDALFQPQQHPARDSQDTFFLKEPMSTESNCLPNHYVQLVKTVHETGGYQSIGWRYPWSHCEAEKNILRTHTTACSARMLYDMGQEYIHTGVFTPKRYFSIDRVFRNETLDATHLAEFHQVEGLICDFNMTLGDLMGVLSTFYKKIGISQLKFKPAYNPYTEPSMEIFGFHPQLNKWIEVGNSGIFRPEMLRPMGLPSNASVIAWGLSLERPTMIQYGIANIRELFGHKALLGVA